MTKRGGGVEETLRAVARLALLPEPPHLAGLGFEITWVFGHDRVVAVFGADRVDIQSLALGKARLVFRG